MDELPGEREVARRPSERKALVEYIAASVGEQETDWLEWKRGYDLTTPKGRASTAKHLLGFANRMPQDAARHAGGHGYLLLGVEPGDLHGVDVHDSADIENWLRPYVGDAVRYDLAYVAAGEVHVLFFVVDPPSWGDPIHPLRKAFTADSKSMPDGVVYVRKPGKTEVAGSADIDRLVQRARRHELRLSLDVRARHSLTAPAMTDFTQAACAIYIRDRRAALMTDVPADAEIGYSYSTLSESRSPSAFEREIHRWADTTERIWPRFAAARNVATDPQWLHFEVVNDSDENYASVRVEVTLPFAGARVLPTDEDVWEQVGIAKEPAPWGGEHQRRMEELVPSPALGPTFDAVELSADVTRVGFLPIHVRPRSTHPVGGVVLMLGPDNAGDEFEVSWRVTSTSVRGDDAGTVTVVIAAG